MQEVHSMKQTIIKAMENLPEENPIDEAMERLYFLSKIEEGVRDLDNGNVHTQEEIEQMVKEWLR